MRGRLWAIAPATIAVALFGAAPASAWWAEGGSYRAGVFGAVFVNGDPGEASDLTVSQSATALADPVTRGEVTVHDPSNPVSAPPAGHGQGCTQVDDHTLKCTGVDIYGNPMNSVPYL